MAKIKEYSHIVMRLSPATASRISNNMSELGIIRAVDGDVVGRLRYLINVSSGFEKKIYRIILSHGMDGIERMAAAITEEYQNQQEAKAEHLLTL